MDNLKDLLLQALVGLFAFLFGIKLIRHLTRTSVQHKHGTTLLQFFSFLLILAAHLLFTTSSLTAYSFFGTLCAALALTIISTIQQETSSIESKVRKAFEPDILDTIDTPPDSRPLNTKAIHRTLLTLQSRRSVITKKVRTYVQVQYVEKDYFVYDITDEYTYEITKETEAKLFWQIVPAWIRKKPHQKSHMRLPLRPSDPMDKWKIEYNPRIWIDHQERWKDFSQRIEVSGHLIDPANGHTRTLDFDKLSKKPSSNHNDSDIQASHLEFSSTAHLTKEYCKLCIVTRNLIHPQDSPIMYFMAWDYCDEWEIEFDFSNTSITLQTINPITNFNSVDTPAMSHQGNSLRARLEARKGHTITPEDAVVLTLNLPFAPTNLSTIGLP